VLGELYDAQWNDTWSRLKICRNDMCSTAFCDRSRNKQRGLA
jgi:predicted RNA-binding Zn ribbon-like protein